MSKAVSKDGKSHEAALRATKPGIIPLPRMRCTNTSLYPPLQGTMPRKVLKAVLACQTLPILRGRKMSLFKDCLCVWVVSAGQDRPVRALLSVRVTPSHPMFTCRRLLLLTRSHPKINHGILLQSHESRCINLRMVLADGSEQTFGDGTVLRGCQEGLTSVSVRKEALNVCTAAEVSSTLTLTYSPSFPQGRGQQD